MTVCLTVDYGYDVHSIEMDLDDFKRIQSGSNVELVGSGFHIEGEVVQDRWVFANRSIHVYCDDGFEIYQGSLDDDSVRHIVR